MKFNVKELLKPINIMEQKLSKMSKEKREEMAIKMWYGATEFRGTNIGLETVWQSIIKKTKKAKQNYVSGKLTEKDFIKWKKFMLKKVYPKTEQSKPIRELIESIKLNESDKKVFDVLLKDIEASRLKAYEEHMQHWCGLVEER